MNKIIRYEAVGSESFDDFIRLVNNMIEDNWQPWGNMIITEENKKTFYYQALVMHED